MVAGAWRFVERTERLGPPPEFVTASRNAAATRAFDTQTEEFPGHGE